MSTTRYSQAGHKFIIEGEMSVGNTIIVTVEPLDGYRFVSWSDGSTENPRSIVIEECGVSYVANIEPIDECDKREIFEELMRLTCGEELFEASDMTCEEISQQLDTIMGSGCDD